MLTADHIKVAYGSRTVLKDVSLHLSAGQVMGIVGPNGAGKSTLIRTLSGVIPLQGGKIMIRSQDIQRLNSLERARQIAVVSQGGQLPPAFTGEEIVLLGRTPHLNWLGQATERDHHLVRQAMQFTETLHLAQRHAGELSGGERQRLLLARALAQNTPILLMDEPTTHLDLHHQLNLLEKLRQLASEQQMAILVILHDINLVARFADQVILLAQGDQIASGTPFEVFTSEVLTETYQTPLQVISIDRTQYVVPDNR